MKRFTLIFTICIFTTCNVWAQDDTKYRIIDTTFVFDPLQYIAIPNSPADDRVVIRDAIWQTGKPAIPYMTEFIGIYDDETLEDYDCSFEDKALLYEDVAIVIFNSDESLSYNWPHSVSSGTISDIGVLDTNLKGFWKKFSFHIGPFEYEASTRSLYLWKKATLKVRMRKQTDTYRPFIEEGKEWITGVIDYENTSGTYDETCHEISRIYFDGDTLVGEYPCKRWMKETTEIIAAGQQTETHLIAPIFEKDRQVFFFYPGETQPRLLYDFSESTTEKELELYSIYDATHQPYIFIRGDGNQQYDAGKFPVSMRGYESIPKGFYTPSFDHSSGIICQIWYEGVGAEKSPDMNIYIKKEGYYNVTSKCTLNGQILCTLWYNDLTALPSLPSEIVNSKSVNNNWYDLSGRRLNTSQPIRRGVYIKDGNKVVVK